MSGPLRPVHSVHTFSILESDRPHLLNKGRGALPVSQATTKTSRLSGGGARAGGWHDNERQSVTRADLRWMSLACGRGRPMMAEDGTGGLFLACPPRNECPAGTVKRKVGGKEGGGMAEHRRRGR